MKRMSKIIKDLKQEEIERVKRLSPSERVEEEFFHMDLVREFFGTGLRLKGFSEKQLKELWQKSKY